jgi:hypothetical protein
VTASIGSNMPAGLTLEAQMEAPAGGLSTGPNALSTAAVDLVTGISTLAQGALDLTYTLSANVSAGVVSTSRTVTYTILVGP